MFDVGPYCALTPSRYAPLHQGERRSMSARPHYLGSPRQRWYVFNEVFKRHDIYPSTSRTILLGQSSVVAHHPKNPSLTFVVCRASTLVTTQPALLSFPGITCLAPRKPGLLLLPLAQVSDSCSVMPPARLRNPPLSQSNLAVVSTISFLLRNCQILRPIFC